MFIKESCCETGFTAGWVVPWTTEECVSREFVTVLAPIAPIKELYCTADFAMAGIEAATLLFDAASSIFALVSFSADCAAIPIKELYWTIERPTAGADEATFVFESASSVLALASSATVVAAVPIKELYWT
ncbi:hypothetical protein, partial [Candidatus Accumulibacter vicinus]|uniref:hypothetical protein n=1 Tax=Candidatus Accumulibacter vicinus TaxID=2954382 RepID=UPI00235B6ED1